MSVCLIDRRSWFDLEPGHAHHAAARFGVCGGQLDSAGFEVSVIDAVGSAIEHSPSGRDDCFLYGLTPDEIVERIDDDVKIIGVSAGFPLSGQPVAS